MMSGKLFFAYFFFLSAVCPAGSYAGDGYGPAQYKAQKKELLKAVALWRTSQYPAACARFKKLGEKDNPVAYYFYSGCISRNSLSVKQKKLAQNLAKAAFPGVKKIAEAGDDLAQYILGKMYSRGEGADKNIPEGVKWYRKSAEKGNPEAQCNIGYAYARGLGLEADEKKATEWFMRSAKSGSPVCQYNLGVRYEDGLGIQADMREAFRFYRMAAAQGEYAAQYRLAQEYESGASAEDKAEAFRLYSASAETGYTLAQYKAGLIWDAGEVVARDPAKALRWWCLAADHERSDEPAVAQAARSAREKIIGSVCNKPEGLAAPGNADGAYSDPGAQFKLGLSYASGEGVGKDLKEALRLWCLAALAGHEPAKTQVVSYTCAE
jgi:hypothetical protein